MEEKVTYYLLFKKFACKVIGDNPLMGKPYIFSDGEWFIDKSHQVMDCLWGYEPGEQLGYRTFNTDVMECIEEIDEQTAFRIITIDTIKLLIEKWRKEWEEDKEHWDDARPLKFKEVGVHFTINGCFASIYPGDIYSYSYYDQAFFVTHKDDVEKDLERYGATDIDFSGTMIEE